MTIKNVCWQTDRRIVECVLIGVEFDCSMLSFFLYRMTRSSTSWSWSTERRDSTRSLTPVPMSVSSTLLLRWVGSFHTAFFHCEWCGCFSLTAYQTSVQLKSSASPIYPVSIKSFSHMNSGGPFWHVAHSRTYDACSLAFNSLDNCLHLVNCHKQGPHGLKRKHCLMPFPLLILKSSGLPCMCENGLNVWLSILL